ncbi:MAG: hypothetical protein RR847_05655 [Bacilli bacterium]
MKKYDLLKVLGIAFLILVVLSWIIVPGSLASGQFVKGEGTTPLGLFDLFRLPVVTIGSCFQYGIIVLLIGGFYGVLNKTGVYEKIVEGLSKKFNGKEKKFLIITMLMFILLSSLTGLTWVLFIIVPFIAAVLLMMGFNKITTLAATVGSILIGLMGATYGFGINGFIINLFEINVNYQIVTKVVFLLVITVLYVGFVTMMATIIKENKPTKKEVAKKTSTKSTTSKKEDKTKKEEKPKEEIKESLDIPLFIKGEAKDKSTWPLIIISIFMILLLLFGMYNFFYSFEIEVFQKFHTNLTEFTIGGYAIFAKLLGNVSAIGYWGNYELAVILIFATILISLIYGIKFKDMMDGFVTGVKQMLKPAFYTVIASIIFVFLVTSGTGNSICDTIVNWILSFSKDFNAFFTSLAAGVGSLFYNDFYYLVYSVTGYYTTAITSASTLGVIGIIYQAIYGLFMLFLPTSIILIAGLSYLDVSYKEWLKYIWKLLLILFVAIIIVIVIVALMV